MFAGLIIYTFTLMILFGFVLVFGPPRWLTAVFIIIVQVLLSFVILAGGVSSRAEFFFPVLDRVTILLACLILIFLLIWGRQPDPPIEMYEPHDGIIWD